MTNLKSVVVTSQQQVATLLEQAARNRAVAATQCNERSSRSHSVFRLHITGRNTITDQTHKSMLLVTEGRGDLGKGGGGRRRGVVFVLYLVGEKFCRNHCSKRSYLRI